MRVVLMILAALALFLSGSIGPSQSLAQQGNEATEHAKSYIQPTPASTNAPDGNPSAKQSRYDGDQDTCLLGEIGEWIADISAQGFFNFIIAVATGLIAWFNWQLVGVTDEMKQATAEAAKAAASGAAAARLALKIDRPYLILEHAQLTGVLRGDDPIRKETPELRELTIPPLFSPRVVLRFRNYGKGPVIFGEGIIRIDALETLPPARDFSGCKRMGLQANAVRAGGIWHPYAQFNFEADWASLFPDIAAEKKSLMAYGCVRYTDPIGKDTYETGFCWIFIPPRTEFQTMPKSVIDLLGPYRAPGAPDPQVPIRIKMPGDFLRGPKTHNYCD